MKSQTELNDAKGQISVKTIEGSEDSRAVDISTLEGNKVATQQEVEKPVIQVEQMPQFPGGDKELMAYISRSLKYPPIATENGIEGRVAIRFVVSNKGDVTNVEILKGLDPSCDKEAMRVIKVDAEVDPGDAKRPKSSSLLHPAYILQTAEVKETKTPEQFCSGVFIHYKA